jgi:hypothetical protein
MPNPDVQATYMAHSQPGEGGYCPGLHLDRGVAWPCEVYMRFHAIIEAELDAQRRELPRRRPQE